MIEIIDKSKCTGCTACANICPMHCIEMIEDEEGFKYPKVKIEKCIHCDLCINICPINKQSNTLNNNALLLKNKADNIREQSTSGGVFFELAQYIISLNGIVFGAFYDEDARKLSHIEVNKDEDIYKILKSKYMQSDLGSIFSKIKSYLDKNIYVMFCGTPCQINGLASFLKKKYDNLVLVDFVCHGVPSQKVWNKYLSFLEHEKKESIKHIYFRYKNNNWSKCSIKIEFEKSTLTQNLSENIYLLNFNESLFLRPSCYDCKFKGKNRLSDITLADAWGINIFADDFYDEKGVSFVITNTNKGKYILSKIQDKFEIKETDIQNLIEYNSQYYLSAKKNKNRDNFFKSLHNDGFSYAINHYGYIPHKSSIYYIKKIIKSLCNKITI